MRSLRHLTPGYLWDRIRLERERRGNPFTPMIAMEVTRLLEDLIGRGHCGLEAGSGASTIWFAERCAHLVSIEHDALWAARVRGWLVERGLADRVDLRLHARISAGTSPLYVGAIDAQSDLSLDFALVDGKRRDACALAAIPKLKPGGLLVVDDIHRYIPGAQPPHTPYSRKPDQGCASPRWASFADVTAQWRCIRRSNGIYETALWIKPCS